MGERVLPGANAAGFIREFSLPMPLYIRLSYKSSTTTRKLPNNYKSKCPIQIFDTYLNNLHLGEYDLRHLETVMLEHLYTWTWTINNELRCYFDLVSSTFSRSTTLNFSSHQRSRQVSLATNSDGATTRSSTLYHRLSLNQQIHDLQFNLALIALVNVGGAKSIYWGQPITANDTEIW
jgi:hypothetical protein